MQSSESFLDFHEDNSYLSTIKKDAMNQTKTYTAKAFARDYQKLIKMIAKRLNSAQEAWEVDDELQALWDLADHGDLDALALYGLAFLKEDKGWYDLEEGKVALENAAEEGSAMAQYYLGRLLMEDRKGLPKDPVLARYWMKLSMEQGFPMAVDYWNEMWGK